MQKIGCFRDCTLYLLITFLKVVPFEQSLTCIWALDRIKRYGRLGALEWGFHLAEINLRCARASRICMLVSEISVLSADGKMDMAIFYVLPTNLKYAFTLQVTGIIKASVF